MLSKDELNEHLAKFNDPELEEGAKAETLMTLKEGLTALYGEHEKIIEEKEKLKEKNNQLIEANAKYFLKLGVQEQSQHEEKVNEKETFSKTVKLSELLKNKSV
jgi:Phi29 scaffolding protein.